MVKFSKQLEAQLIPEWKDAFVNYWQLKKHVKKIKLSRSSNHTQECDIGISIFDPIRFLANKLSHRLHSARDSPEIIEVHKVKNIYRSIYKIKGSWTADERSLSLVIKIEVLTKQFGVPSKESKI